MRRLALCMLVLSLFLFTSACSGEQNPREHVLELRERFLSSTQHFSAELTADYGDRVHHFTLRFDSETSTLEVLAPALIAGIIIEVSESGTVLHFEGAELNTGPITEDGLSPLAALPTIVAQWKEGHITGAHYETFGGIRCVVMTTDISDIVRHMTWFDAETGIPVKAEILENGFAVLTAAFEGGPLFGASNG